MICATPLRLLRDLPVPEDWETDPTLEAAGKAYYEFRAALMVRNNEGLTKTYNRFHDPDERSPDILKLRELHAAMDRAVLDAYGWTDSDRPASSSSTTRTTRRTRTARPQAKKPWRYRWPDDVRDEVLARLLDLNRNAPRRSASPALVPRLAAPPHWARGRLDANESSPALRA